MKLIKSLQIVIVINFFYKFINKDNYSRIINAYLFIHMLCCNNTFDQFRVIIYLMALQIMF